VNVHNHGNKVVIHFAKEYEFVYNTEPWTTKKIMAVTPES